MKNLTRSFLALSVLLSGAIAHADVISFDILGENDCVGYYGGGQGDGGFDSCVISGTSDDGNVDISSIIAKYDFEEGWEINREYDGAFDSGDMDIDMINSLSGSWEYSVAGQVRFWVIKHGNGFAVYYDTDSANCLAEDADAGSAACMMTANYVTGGDWNVEARGLSHISFYNSEVKVPEPGTLALLGMGLLGFGAARRKRKAT